MSLGSLLGKIATAPIKLSVMPIRTMVEVMESCDDDVVKTVTESIEDQLKDIID